MIFIINIVNFVCFRWDADYVQHWLRLDETRSALQQQMEYDAAELEDWSMEDSEIWRKCEPTTPSQILPSIQETNTSELEEDSNECLWNSSSYLTDQVLTVDGSDPGRGFWPYGNRSLISPGGDSWSSAGTTSEDGRSFNDGCLNGGSKRSSTAMSTDSGELPAIGTDFTRDFYRLVKFESTKSLASTSSRSQAGDSINFRKGDIPVSMPVSSDREQALQSVLHFIAEQQQYCLSREVADSRPSDICLEEMSPESKDTLGCLHSSEDIKTSNENEVRNCPNRKLTLSAESLLNEQNISPVLNFCDQTNSVSDKLCKTFSESSTVKSQDEQSSFLIGEVFESSHLVNELENNTEQLDRNCKEIIVEKSKIPEFSESESLISRPLRVDGGRSSLRPVPEEDEDHPGMSESQTSTMSTSISTPDTVIKVHSSASDDNQSESVLSLPGSTSVQCSEDSVVVAGPKSLSFHEHATSKDVIDELNRMIRKGEDGAEVETAEVTTNLDMACCCPTGWVHVEREIDFTDPKVKIFFNVVN